MDIILKYFPDLTETQKEQFAALYDLYTDWNSKINVISRKDITNLYEHHVLSLAGGICQVLSSSSRGNTYHGPGHGRWFSGHTACYFIPRLNVSSGRQHRKESQGCNRNCQCHRTEKTLQHATAALKRKNKCSTL